LIVFINIDEVISIIRNEDEPKKVLQKKFKLSVIQVDAILEIRLRQLAKLEEIKIKEEQGSLDSERKDLEKLLGSKTRLKTLIKKELKADAEVYGDKRNSPIVYREEATAFDETELISSDPVTVILSERGWVRAAKGHDIEPESLNYREGDTFFASAKGRNNQNAIFLDSKGKAYTLPCHSLPSARSQGEPLSGRLNAESGETFAGVISGPIESQVVLTSSSGYGFVANLGDLQTKNKSGKAALKVQEGAQVLIPRAVENENDVLAAITNQGRMLVFPLTELPQLARGKGNKIIGIPKASFESGEEFLQEVAVLGEGRELRLLSGKRHFTIKSKDLENFVGNRGRRGNFLPKGFRNVDGIEVIGTDQSNNKEEN
ncbi:MAG TPA: DNA gyrase C-terminal beta-propeller domain-containing protein, partial [SAR86 cluster bacterium]|nr:DNA gyrase C-terminal beta-propeller domain-containing protein [SAR86 cluster bacterium]